MSERQCRIPIALAAVVAALLWSKPAHAQIGGPAFSPPREPGGLVNNLAIGVQYDIVNKEKAEQRLERLQARQRLDAERGDSAAYNRDGSRIAYTRHRIAVDVWLIRKNRLYDPGCYPYPVCLDPMTYAAITRAGGR